MPPDFDSRLRALAEVVVRVGLNLQPGQPLIITDPYDLLGVHPEAAGLAAAIQSLAGGRATVIPADPPALRRLIEADDLHTYEKQVETHTRWLRGNLARGGAFLFLTGSAPRLFAGLPADRLARFEVVKWNHLGPLIQLLVRGLAQWTLIPAPSRDWAEQAGRSVPELWETMFAALRLDAAEPTSAWREHLAALARQRDELNARRPQRVRYTGAGTDLTVELPRSHTWCSTQLTTARGVSFVTNLPTEELFTAPHKNSASGTVRVARPVAHNGAILDGVELEFRSGRVVRANARAGQDHLRSLLATDDGASRLGEVAMVPNADKISWAGRCHHHILLDENAGPHVALGSAYRFCSRAWLPLALNSSQLHLDLPLDAEVEFV